MIPNLDLTLTSIADTHRLAAVIAANIPGGTFIGLSGPLGVGKTEFVRGVAEALGASEQVASPTFVVEAVYNVCSNRRPDIKSIHHWDLYRVGKSYQDNELRDYLEDSSKLVFIEWPEYAPWIEEMLSLKISLNFVGGARLMQAASMNTVLVEDCIREVHIGESELMSVRSALATFHPTEAMI